PARFVLAGGLAYWLETRRRAASLPIAAAVLACVVASVSTWPHYLAYFNQLAGGPRQAYRHLVDSSLDWGQDLPGLARWLQRNVPSGTPVYLSYFGTGNPDYYHIKARRLPGFFDEWRPREWYQLTGGVYAVSATMLQSVVRVAGEGTRGAGERGALARDGAGRFDPRGVRAGRPPRLRQLGRPRVRDSEPRRLPRAQPRGCSVGVHPSPRRDLASDHV